MALRAGATGLGCPTVAELVFFSGTMDCGKSTLALQMDHNHRARGREGLIFTRHAARVNPADVEVP